MPYLERRSTETCSGTFPNTSLLLLGFGLLLQVKLDTALPSLSLVMLIRVFGLGLTVASQASDSTTHGSLETITNTLAKVADLTLGFLTLTLQVLLTALLLQVLVANEVAGGFFDAADGLIPLAFGAITVVLGCAGRGDGEGASFGCSVRKVGLGGAFVLVLFGFGLESWSVKPFRLRRV